MAGQEWEETILQEEAEEEEAEVVVVATPFYILLISTIHRLIFHRIVTWEEAVK